MKNKRIEVVKKKYVTRWQDGSYDPYNDCYREVVSKKSYWDWMEENSKRNEEGEIVELSTANPDVLGESDGAWTENNEDLSEQHTLFQEAVSTLTEAQRAVWNLCMKEDPVTQEIAAKMLGISQQVVSKTLKAAIKKVEKYCNSNASRLSGELENG